MKDGPDQAIRRPTALAVLAVAAVAAVGLNGQPTILRCADGRAAPDGAQITKGKRGAGGDHGKHGDDPSFGRAFAPSGSNPNEPWDHVGQTAVTIVAVPSSDACVRKAHLLDMG